jgi:pilus assembly protein CpaC
MTMLTKHGASPMPRHSGNRTLRCVLLPACLLLACFCGVQCIAAQTGNPSGEPATSPLGAAAVPLALQSAAAGDVLHLVVGHSILLVSAAPLRRIYVGNPAVLQTYTSGAAEIVLTAKTLGVSSMVLWDDAGGHRLYTVFADLDPAALQASLLQAFPGASIHAEAGEGRIFLTGSVATDAASDAAVKIASQYAKDVVNSIRIDPVHGKQVQLKLRIVEVDRTRLEQMGINIFAGGRTALATTTGQFPSTETGSGSSFSVSDPMNFLLYNSKLDLGLTIKDLEEKQVLQVLAEPTLTTVSGLTARFLSGGEFPFPVIQPGGAGGAASVTIQFRPYGVKVDFTPTVSADGIIHLKLSPEVSALDYSNAVTISGYTIPALSTRRAETEVEIRDGQSFAVSGLLDHRTTEIMSKVPGIADLPILGQLFRSKNFNHSVVELVIVVTASIVDPLSSSAASTAEPKFVVPNLDSDSFDASAVGKSRSGAAQPESPPAQPATQKGPDSQ